MSLRPLIDADREARRAESKRKADECLAAWGKHLRPGVIITHTRCMGCIEEHVFTGMDGYALCGYPTADTFKFEGHEGKRREFLADDIHPSNVTHINRLPVSVLDVADPRSLLPKEGKWVKTAGGVK